MAIFKVKVVVLSKDIARHHRSVSHTMLLEVAAIHNVHHPLGKAVAIVGVMRRPFVDLIYNWKFLLNKRLTILLKFTMVSSSG